MSKNDDLHGSLESELSLQPSNIENIDRALFEWVNESLNIHTSTNKGWDKVPVVWLTAERAYQIKHDKTLRDTGGTIILPMITVERTSITKDPNRKGTYWANVPKVGDAKRGSITVAKRVKHDKTAQHNNAASGRKWGQGGVGHGQMNFPSSKARPMIYETLSVPMPVYITATYTILVKTEYQEQMNGLITPFITSPGAINYIPLSRNGHLYEGFVQQNYSIGNNIADMGEDERKYETKIEIQVLGYIIGDLENEDTPRVVRRETATQVKMPRERVMTGDIPMHENGNRFYGLAGFTEQKRLPDVKIPRPAIPMSPPAAKPRPPAIERHGGTLESEIAFQPSTMETIDRAFFDWIDNGLNIQAATNTGWGKVPVVWLTAERAYQVKNDKTLRDDAGVVILPVVTVERTSLVKDLNKKGTYWANVPKVGDTKQGAITIAKRLLHGKTSQYNNAASKRKWGNGNVGHGQINFPGRSKPAIYETLSIPMPVYVTVTYSVLLKAEYQKQIDGMVAPFITRPGAINYIPLTRDGHLYEAFIKQDYSLSNNVAEVGEEERKYETKIDIEVLGYLVGDQKNEDTPKVVRRETAVQVKMPRERVILGDIATHEDGGRFFGLAGFTKQKVVPPVKLSLPSSLGLGSGGGGATPDGVVTSAEVTSDGTSHTLTLGRSAGFGDLTATWTDVTGSGADALVIKNSGETVTETPASINFSGSSLSVSTVGNDVTVTFNTGSNLIVRNSGDQLTNNLNALNFTGSGVTTSVAGDDVTVTINTGSSLVVQNSGQNLTTNAASINFTGSAVTATNSGDNVTVTINTGSSVIVKGSGTELTSNLSSINFTGSGVSTSVSDNDVTVTFNTGSSLVVQNSGQNLSTNAASINFTGSAVTATNSGNDITVTINTGSVIVKDSGDVLTKNLQELIFTGSAVSTSVSGNDVTVTINTGSSGGTDLIIKNSGDNVVTEASSINFTGSGGTTIAVSNSGNDVTVTVSSSVGGGGGGGTDVQVLNSSDSLTTGVESINFTGSGVTATTSGNDVTVTVVAGSNGNTFNTSIFNNSTYSETPSGLVNDSNTVYTTSQNFISGSELLFHNGLLMRRGASYDYNITDNDEITFTFSPGSGDFILISYVNNTES